MKRVILFGAFMVALGGAANAATPKTETKTETKAETQAGGTVQWFHFIGSNSSPTDLTDPSKYTSEATPTCPDQLEDNRCDIKIASSTSNPNQPDLSQQVMDERTRTAD